MVQTLGLQGFSFADIAREIGVTTASIHYHFPTKADLASRLIERYGDRFFEALGGFERESSKAADWLRCYFELHEGVLANGRLCLCGMMASDFEALDESTKVKLQQFFRRNEDWLTGMLKRGRDAGELRTQQGPRELSRLVIGALEGGMLVARVHGDVASFRVLTKSLHQMLCGA